MERNKKLNDFLLSLSDERAGATIKNWIQYQRTGSGLYPELVRFAEISRKRSELAHAREQGKILNKNNH